MVSRTFGAFSDGRGRACNCIGPQNGEPRCPCMMIGLVERDGRWIEPERDLGPVRAACPRCHHAMVSASLCGNCGWVKPQ